MLKRIALIICFSSAVLTYYAQPEGAVTRLVAGEEYYVHKVKAGNTVYGLHKLYGVSIDEILLANPEAKDGLNPGDELLIPKQEVREETNDDQVQLPPKDTSKYLIHIVKQGETLYSIAKQYSIKGSDLVKINGINILSIGDKILIPKSVQADHNQNDEVEPAIKNPINELLASGDSIVLHRVKKGETLYALSKLYHVTPDEIVKANDGLKGGLKRGQEIRIPLKVKRPKQVPVDTLANPAFNQAEWVDSILKKEVYNVGVFLPFKLDKFDEELLKCPPVGDCKPFIPTIRAVEFYQGVEMAVDSMRSAGLSVNLHVYDTKGDTGIVRNILSKNEVKSLDLIFGPLSHSTQPLVADYALANKIQFVSPVNSSNKLLFKNPFVTKAIASIPTQMNAIAQYVADSFATQSIILFDNKDAKDQSYFAKVFERRYNELTDGDTAKYRDTLAIIEKGVDLKNMYPYLNMTGTNVLILPSRNIGYVSSFLTDLNKVKNDQGMRDVKFVVFGVEEWKKFKQIDYEYINDFHVHLSSSKYVDYSSAKTIDFIKRFRKKYQNDPGLYSFMGFDVMIQHLAGLLHFGKGFASRLNYIQLDHLHTAFNYELVGEGSGYENQQVFILAYEDYKLIRKK